MISIFSSFDLSFYKLWILILILMSCGHNSHMMKLNSFMKLEKLIKNSLMLFFQSLDKKNLPKSLVFLIIMMMYLNILLNLSSVSSFSFPFNTQFGMVFFTSLTLWLSLFMFNLIGNFKGLISHTVPEGCPIYLALFLVAIEIVSILIRPLTLSIRLTANILAGHVLLILISYLIFLQPNLLILHTILCTFEFMVALIQSYIFVTMITLYYGDIN